MATNADRAQRQPEAASPTGGSSHTNPTGLQNSETGLSSPQIPRTDDFRNPRNEVASTPRQHVESMDVEDYARLGASDGRATRLPDIEEDALSAGMQNLGRQGQGHDNTAPAPTPSEPVDRMIVDDDGPQTKQEWRRLGKPLCKTCGKMHPPPCDPELVQRGQELERLKNDDPGEFIRRLDALSAERKRKRDDHEDAQRVNAQTGRSSTDMPKAKKHPIDFEKSITFSSGNKALPVGFCTMCLVQHRQWDKAGSYHVRPPQESMAMHQAIASGRLPKVDPWESISLPSSAKVATNKKGPEQDLSKVASASFDPSAKLMSFISEKTKNDDSLTAFTAIGALLQGDAQERRQNLSEATAQVSSNATFGYGSYAAAAASTGDTRFPALGSKKQAPTGKLSKSQKTDLATKRAKSRQMLPDKNERYGNGQRSTYQGLGAPANVNAQNAAKQADSTNEVQRNTSASKNATPASSHSTTSGDSDETVKPAVQNTAAEETPQKTPN